MDQDLSLTEVIEANALFYAALEGGDMNAMAALWSRRAGISAYHPFYHPEWPVTSGYDNVMNSWRSSLLRRDPAPRSTEIHAIIRTLHTAMVFCIEDIEGFSMTASNVFVREDGAWRLATLYADILPKDGAAGGDD